MAYPDTRKSDVVDTYFGVNVPDPYRWLEDDRSEATAAWVREQNAVTSRYLEQIPYLDQLRSRLKTLLNYERESAPVKEGRYTWFYRNTGLQNQDVLFRQLGDEAPVVFLDPNTFSEDGTTSLAQVAFSRDGSKLAYAISEGGSDWRKIFVLDAETGAALEPPIVDVKFSGIDWWGNEGFYYSSYEKPDGSELSAKVDQHRLYFHRLGQKQIEDELVFGGDPAEKRRYVSADVTEDGRFLSITGSQATSGNDLYMRDLSKPGAPLVPVLTDFESDTYVVDSRGDQLILKTNRNAPNGRVVVVDAADPAPANWIDLIPETTDVLTVSTGGGYLFAEYMADAISRIYQFDYDGNRLREIELPGPGSAGSVSGKRDDTTLYYTFTNYKTPPTIYAFDVAPATSRVYRASAADFDADSYVSEQVFYSSKDGTRIPMIITRRRDITLDGSNPTILYGYGGFNISLTPAYSSGNALWLEQGGVLAIPNLRGGGEYGKAWHQAGTLVNKQNVFDDFIAAAEFLFDQGYTSPARLALRGGSNGGLLVGAVMTQRPELAKVALPAVGVMDMLRYHTFTAGAGWAYDYGTVEDDKKMFEYLLGYSPLHNLKAGVSYPATLVTTSDHDDRVVPAHSFKFAATLQASQMGNNPVLIRIETQAGHGAGTPIAKQIDLLADVLGFAFYNLGVPPRIAAD